jgi:hypothetical protein
MKYYCEKCRSVFEPGVLKMIDGVYSCPMCKKAMERIPYNETPQQYEKRTGKAYPDKMLVFFRWLGDKDNGAGPWHIDTYEIAKLNVDEYRQWQVVIADPPVPPPDGWKPEND